MIAPLKDGRLRVSTTAELAKVLTPENLDEVLPRYYGLSAREAAEVTAALQPRPQPPSRTVVTELSLDRPAALAPQVCATTPEMAMRTLGVVQTFELVTAPRTEVEPLSADLRRLHVTVSRQLLAKLEAAREGLSHALPNATTEQVLEAGLEALLEKQAKARGQAKRPRTTIDAPAATGQTPTDPPHHRRVRLRTAIPAKVKRAVWARDGGRCSWPLDGGGSCGSTHRLELDHVVPWARGGDHSAANLRLTCGRHNALAARREFGAQLAARYAPGP